MYHASYFNLINEVDFIFIIQIRIQNPYMELRKRIGGQIRAIRRAMNLTQAELASQVERSTEAISNLERGVSLPGLDTLEAIAAALDTPLEVFFMQQAKGKLTKDRSDMLQRLTAIANGLPDKKLKLAIVQVEAIADLT